MRGALGAAASRASVALAGVARTGRPAVARVAAPPLWAPAAAVPRTTRVGGGRTRARPLGGGWGAARIGVRAASIAGGDDGGDAGGGKRKYSLPIFPLGTTALPGVVLPLNIFEVRVLMLARFLRRRRSARLCC